MEVAERKLWCIEAGSGASEGFVSTEAEQRRERRGEERKERREE